jgi:hypothetical protein
VEEGPDDYTDDPFDFPSQTQTPVRSNQSFLGGKERERTRIDLRDYYQDQDDDEDLFPSHEGEDEGREEEGYPQDNVIDLGGEDNIDYGLRATDVDQNHDSDIDWATNPAGEEGGEGAEAEGEGEGREDVWVDEGEAQAHEIHESDLDDGMGEEGKEAVEEEGEAGEGWSDEVADLEGLKEAGDMEEMQFEEEGEDGEAEGMEEDEDDLPQDSRQETTKAPQPRTPFANFFSVLPSDPVTRKTSMAQKKVAPTASAPPRTAFALGSNTKVASSSTRGGLDFFGQQKSASLPKTATLGGHPKQNLGQPKTTKVASSSTGGGLDFFRAPQKSTSLATSKVTSSSTGGGSDFFGAPQESSALSKAVPKPSLSKEGPPKMVPVKPKPVLPYVHPLL